VPRPDDASPDPLKLPEDDLLGGMPFGDQPAAQGSPHPESPDALMEEASAEESEPVKGKKKQKKEKRKKERKEKKPAKVKAPKVKVPKAPGQPLMTKIRHASPYTVMLAVALSSLVIGVSFLVLHLSRYEFKFHP
jgi:hypothetical protein